jgi:hypothetical protein
MIGLFLLAIWIAGLSVQTQAWITWLDFVAGLLSIAIGIAPLRRGGVATTAAAPIVVSLGLFAMWIVGLAVHTEAWITWCTFGAACALLVDAIGGGFTVQRMQTA